jgi:hypothetical protein
MGSCKKRQLLQRTVNASRSRTGGSDSDRSTSGFPRLRILASWRSRTLGLPTKSDRKAAWCRSAHRFTGEPEHTLHRKHPLALDLGRQNWMPVRSPGSLSSKPLLPGIKRPSFGKPDPHQAHYRPPESGAGGKLSEWTQCRSASMRFRRSGQSFPAPLPFPLPCHRPG